MTRMRDFTGKYNQFQSLRFTDHICVNEVISGSLFENCVFENIAFSKTIIQASNFINCKFVNCKFHNCNFSFSKLNGCNFVACTIKGSNFCTTNSLHTNFLSCMLQNNIYRNGYARKNAFISTSMGEKSEEHFFSLNNTNLIMTEEVVTPLSQLAA